MKHFSYLVTIVLIMMVALTQGFASKGSKAGVVSFANPQLQQTQGPSGRIQDNEIRTRSSINKNANRVSSSMRAQTWKPIPKVDNTSSITAGLSGTYHIPGDFSTIGNAVAVLNFVGISGAVTFQLDNASYSELSPITFGGTYPGAGTATVTVQPKAGVAVTVNFIPSASEGKGFAFNGSKKVTIDGLNTGGASLTLQYSGGTFPAGDAFAATIYVTGGSSDVTVQNANIKGEIQTAATFYDQTDGRPATFIYRANADAANSTNISINHCTITNATYGIKALTEGASSNGPNISYTYNNVGGAFGGMVSLGGLMDGVVGMHYDNNVIDGIEFVPYYWENGPTEFDLVNFTFAPPNDFLFDFGQPTGGHMYQCTSSTMNYNWVKDSHQAYNDPGFPFIIYGLLNRVGGAATVIHDNRITGVHSTDADGTDVGLRTESGAIHNSIRLTGTQGATQVSYCLRPAAGNILNNALSNERTGGTAANTRALQGTPVGTSNGNAMFSTGRISSTTSLNLYLATGKDANSQFGAVGFDASMHLATFPSSAENIGQPRILLANDVDGTARDTTGAGTRDAGADEVLANSGLSTATDVMPILINPPSAAGVPAGLAQTPTVTVKNNSTTATGAFNLNLTITGGPVYNNDVSISLGSLETKSFTFPAWTPTAGAYTFTTTTSLGGDGTPGNDVLTRAQSASAPHAIVGSESYWTAASADSWVGSGDFVFSAAFAKAKIGGPFAGSSWVTKTTGNYTNAAAHMVTSQFYDLSALGGDGNVYMSFYQSLAVEPSWDRSWVQYSTDGVNWSNLGVLNDPNGVNWYATTVYANAAGSNAAPDCWDGVTALGLGLVPNDATVPAAWTSNGDCGGADLHTGPNGYVYTQLKITPANYPTLVGAPIVKFRFVAFADAGSGDDGWAIDNMRIGGTAPPLTDAGFSGNVYTDTDGNGAKNGGETGTAGLVLDLTYFGVHVAFATSDVNGDYSFPAGPSALHAPGNYKVTIATGLGLSQPALGYYTVAYLGTGISVTGADFGLYNGAVTGKKFDDVNNNGADNSEPGLSGWTIELHRDSCNGVLLRSGVTGAGGLYSIPVGPGTYYVKEVLQAGWRSTTGICVGSVTVSGVSGSGTAVVSAPSIGNFKFAAIKVSVTQDANGNGVYDGVPDNFALPGGAREIIQFKKNGVTIFTDTLGNGVDNVTHANLDTATYTTVPLGVAPTGWIRTLSPNPGTVVVATSGMTPTVNYLDYELQSVSGQVYEDHNGNGAKDGGDQGVAGDTITLTGTGGGSTVSDGGGNYSFANVGPGAHVLTQSIPGTKTNTEPVAHQYSFNGQSRNLGGDITGQLFGNFTNVSISGLKYRDRNGNGTQDAGDNGLSGWTINKTSPVGSTVTDGSGAWSFSNLGPGTYVITETAQLGYTKTEPVGPNYTIIASSAVNTSGLKFGNFAAGDTVLYRTWTVNELKAASEAKAAKRPKPGKPYVAPNSANMLVDLLSAPKSAILKVGLAGQLIGGKEKGYLQPAKQAEVYKTLNDKGVSHVGNPKPLSFDNSGLKRLLKRLKTLSAKKTNDILAVDLLALRINIAASALGQTGVGLGNVLYCEASNPLGAAHMSLGAIADAADSLMTNWDVMGQPGFTAPIYVMYDTVVAKINAAFSTGLTTDITDSAAWHSLAVIKLKWKLKSTAQSVAYLCAPGPGIAPASSPVVTENNPVAIPDVYALAQNYPNPFNPTTTISFDLPMSSIVTLKVYNILGQEVMTLLNHESLDAGTQEEDFDATSLTSGVYFYRLTAQGVDDDGINNGNTFTQVKKMLLVK